MFSLGYCSYTNILQLGYDATFHLAIVVASFALQLAQLYCGLGIVRPIYSLQYSHYLCGLHMSWLMLYCYINSFCRYLCWIVYEVKHNSTTPKYAHSYIMLLYVRTHVLILQYMVTRTTFAYIYITHSRRLGQYDIASFVQYPCSLASSLSDTLGGCYLCSKSLQFRLLQSRSFTTTSHDLSKY